MPAARKNMAAVKAVWHTAERIDEGWQAKDVQTMTLALISFNGEYCS
jgi:hypothetical protein